MKKSQYQGLPDKGEGTMRFVSAALSIWFGLSGAAGAEGADCSDKLDAPKNQAAARPVLVLLETEPWAMVMGADSPRFALYDNGVAIYRTKSGFRQILLEKAQANDLRTAVNVGALACLNKHYSTSDWSDQPYEYLFFGRGGRLSGISVYGRIPSGRGVSQLPASFVAAYERLTTFDDPKARPWIPDYVEVMLWPYEYAPEPSIIWPSKWPGLKDPSTVRRHDDAYSLYVPSRDYEELLAFLKTRHEKGAVEIDKKKWAVDLRFPFPQESNWQSTMKDLE